MAPMAEVQSTLSGFVRTTPPANAWTIQKTATSATPAATKCGAFLIVTMSDFLPALAEKLKKETDDLNYVTLRHTGYDRRGALYDVLCGDETIVTGTRTPERAAAFALHHRGKEGPMTTLSERGTPRMHFQSVNGAAGLLPKQSRKAA